MGFVLMCLLLFPLFRKSTSNTEAYLRAREYMRSKKYEEAGHLADSLILEGYKDKDVLYILMYSLYKRAMWDSIVILSSKFKDYRLPLKSKEYSDIMFMTGVSYFKKNNISFAVYYLVKSANSTKSKKRAESFVKNYIGMSSLPEFLSMDWLTKPYKPALLSVSNEIGATESSFLNGFVLGLKGSVPFVRLKSLKDVDKVSLLVGPLLSYNVSKVFSYLKDVFQPSIFPLAEDVRIGLSIPLFPLNRRYAVEVAKGITFFSERLGYMNYAIYYQVDDPIAVSSMIFLKKAIAQRGLYISHLTGFTDDSISIISEIDSTTGENWDAVFVLGRSDFSLTLATTLRREVEDLPVFIFSDFKWKVTQGGYVGLNGVFFAGYYSGEREMLDLLSRKQRFQDLFNAQFGTNPSYFAQRGYDVGVLVRKIATSVDTFNRKNVINYLYNIGVYEGISGYFLFRDDPTLIKVYTFKNGKVVEFKED